jgi:hypothetical protein
MCFRINHSAVRPTVPIVYKVLAETPDGRLVSPFIYGRIQKEDRAGAWRRRIADLTLLDASLTWEINRTQRCDLPADHYLETNDETGNPCPADSAAFAERVRAGLHVFLNEESALRMAARMNVEHSGYQWVDNAKHRAFACRAHPADWLYTGADDLGNNCATYRAVTPLRIIGETK